MPDNPSGQLPADHGIGQLKWFVTLYRRDQFPADDETLALVERLVPIARVHADIQPAYLSTFYQSTQVDTPVTHIISIRWQRFLSTVEVIVRSSSGNDLVTHSELFRVRRAKQIAGRKRFIQMECELEHARLTPDDSDSTRNAMLTEPYDGEAASPPQISPAARPEVTPR